jgi:hypothetical protein
VAQQPASSGDRERLRPSRVEKSRGTAAPVKNDRAAVGAGSVFVH